jgi:hypothetical protein
MLKTALIKNSPVPDIRYIDRYISFIEKCKLIPLFVSFEKHHILPKSFGGNNGDNLIKLSPRHHYIAHILLAKATGSPKMIKALHKMIYSRTGDVIREYKISSRMYEYLKIEHAKIVSAYSKNTVTAKHMYTNEVKRIPKKLFDQYNGVLYEATAKGRKDSQVTIELKRIASKKPRKVKQGTRVRSLAASRYSYITPKGYCENSTDLLNLYSTFTKNTLTVLEDEFVISHKFASIHNEFKDYVGKKLKDIGFTRKIK